MKTIVQRGYGGPDALEVPEDRPTVRQNEDLVRVHAASVHLGDSILMLNGPAGGLTAGLRLPGSRADAGARRR